jgi:hypothetical protein
MLGNFFKATCPYLYELDTVAYFAIKRNHHTYSTIAGIRETTQLLLDLYQINNKTYIHPLKVWQRYSPTMFFPHFIQDQEAVCITSSSDASELFNSINRSEMRLDYWNTIFNNAKGMLCASAEEQRRKKTPYAYAYRQRIPDVSAVRPVFFPEGYSCHCLQRNRHRFYWRKKRWYASGEKNSGS